MQLYGGCKPVCGHVLDVDVSEEEAKLILDCVMGKDGSVANKQHGELLPHSPSDGRGCTLLELLKQEQELGSIVTFCARVDEMLGECALCLCAYMSCSHVRNRSLSLL